MLHEYIGLSVILGFLSSELLGLYTGGMVSAGYLAFYADSPFRLASTMAVAAGTCLLTRLLGKFVIIYGRRRFMATILISLIGVWLFERFFYSLSVIPEDIRVVGYIVPGLLANDMMKQGIIKTIALASVCMLIIRLVVMTGVL